MNKQLERAILKFIELLPTVSEGLTQQRLDALILRLTRELTNKRITSSDISESLVDSWMFEFSQFQKKWVACSTNFIAPQHKVYGGEILNWQFHEQALVTVIDEARYTKLEVDVWPIQIISGYRLNDPRNGPSYDGEFFYTTAICKYSPKSVKVETLNTIYELVGERGVIGALPASMSAEQVKEYYIQNSEERPSGYLY